MARFHDGDWELFDWEPHTGRTTWRLYDGEKETFRIDYPVENIVRENGEQYNDHSGARWDGGRRVASIPLNVFHDENVGLDKAHLEGDEKYLAKWLNDGDNVKFRTFPGRV